MIGGATLLDSPLLRRPDLLRSMVAFWQNHPSLSYLFSGMYVGPTSQYPRVDEARMDALYELESCLSSICLQAIVHRSLSMDCSAICSPISRETRIAPSSASTSFIRREGLGLQLGLLELRAFEMAPHVQMNLLQMLLIRALVSMFWKTPFEGESDPLGHRTSRPLHVAGFCQAGPSRGARSVAVGRVQLRGRVVCFAFGVSLSEDRLDRCGRSRTRTASGARALERARGGDLFRPHGSYRGLIDGADAGEGVRVPNGIPLRCCLQWAQGAASTYRRARDSVRRRALSCAAVVGDRCTLRFPFMRRLSSTLSTA